MTEVEKVILDPEVLAAKLDTMRQEGKCIVSTNGVFDVLHVGHVRYLQAARKLGNILVVGVNTDAGTRRLKGPLRPIVPEAQRAELLAALQCVDFVTLFDEPTPEKLLEKIKPDIHTKGGDYDPAALPETAVVVRNGGEVVTLPFVADHSTTDLIARIQTANGPSKEP